MSGGRRRNNTYYLRWPRGNNRGRPDSNAGHPNAVYLREDAILDAVTRFFAIRTRHDSHQATIAIRVPADQLPASPPAQRPTL